MFLTSIIVWTKGESCGTYCRTSLNSAGFQSPEGVCAATTHQIGAPAVVFFGVSPQSHSSDVSAGFNDTREPAA